MENIQKITLKIEGEIGKHNTIPVDYLVKLAVKLQNLILDLAKYDLPTDEPIDLNNFKLELSDFKTGSSVPSFVYSTSIQHTTISTIDEQRELVTNKFNNLMSVATNGNYLSLNEYYPEPVKRNPIANSLYEFVDSFKNVPVSVIDEQNRIIYRIKAFPKEMRDKVVTNIKENEKEKTTSNKTVQLARVEISEGKSKPKVLNLFDKKYNQIQFAPEVIIHNDKIYDLKFPLLSSMDTIDNITKIENLMLGIYAIGNTPDEAEAMFAEEFDYIYSRYNELDDDKLTADVQSIKSFINFIVKK